MKQGVLLSILGAVVVCCLARAQNPAVTVQGYHIMGPAAPAEFPRWIADMKRWRMEYLKRLGYDDSEYKRPELLWTQSSFMQPQMMVEDRYFYDPGAGKYTVDRYLDDLEKRYGGIDSVLIWPVYWTATWDHAVIFPNTKNDRATTDKRAQSFAIEFVRYCSTAVNS